MYISDNDVARLTELLSAIRNESSGTKIRRNRLPNLADKASLILVRAKRKNKNTIKF